MSIVKFHVKNLFSLTKEIHCFARILVPRVKKPQTNKNFMASKELLNYSLTYAITTVQVLDNEN